MRTYQKANAVIKARVSKKLGNNTYLVRDGENLAVRLHQTNVVTYHPDGRIILNSGGWRTMTTKDRINKYAPVNLWQDKGQWFVSPQGLSTWQECQENKAIYQDNMVINPGGSFSGVMSAAEAKEEQKLREQVRKYAKGYVTALKAGKVGAPSGGDCWGCCMRDAETGKTVMGNGHIREHLIEKYYVPSLAWNALEALGGSIAAKHTVAAYQGLHDQGPWPGDFITEQIEKTIRRYVYRELGIAY